MEQINDFRNVLDWLRRQELANAHVVSVLEGRHTPQFSALKRVLDNKSLENINKQTFSVFVDSARAPGLVLVVWDSEPCEHWHSPPRRIVEITASTRADLSGAQSPILDSFSDEREMCIVTNDKRAWGWVRENCSPITWHLNVVYTVQKPRYNGQLSVPVKLLTARDTKAVSEFVERAGSEEHGSTIGQFELAKRGMFYRCYGTFSKDRLTGFLTLFERTANVWEVLWVRVDAEFRGQGIGSLLLAKATNEILAAAKIPMYLTTPSNIPAISMISNMGFSFAYERYTAQITEI